jgi:predicted anti-sigma-YlaC factor YlaD
MNCRKINRMMEDYFDDMLPLNKRRQFEEHIRNCPGCKNLLLERKQLGRLISDSMKKMADHLEFSPKVIKSVRGISSIRKPKPFPKLILLPKWVVYAWSPILVLGLVLLVFHFKKEKKELTDSTEQAAISYLELTTTHYRGTLPDEWTVKRTHIEKSNGEEGFLTLELKKNLKSSEED